VSSSSSCAWWCFVSNVYHALACGVLL
jgi:hypothetical protein